MYFEAAEISLTDYCNRACSFCPQVMPEFQNLYKNKMMEFSTLENIKRDFEKFDKRPLIILAGFGEPLLYKKIDHVLDLFSGAGGFSLGGPDSIWPGTYNNNLAPG